MTYPQPPASDSVIAGDDAYRLRTQLLSPGDIYEADVSGLAFAIGPDSDLANVQIVYLDPLIPSTAQGQFRLSVDRAFVGRIDADPLNPYPLSQRPGRILMYPDDLYDPAYRPAAFGVNDVIEFVAPTMDVLQYFGNVPSVAPERSDKEFFYKYFDPPVGAAFWLALPFYGRRYAHLTMFNENNADDQVWGVYGVRFSMTDDPTAHYEETLRAPASVAAAGGMADLIVRASNQGMFDFLVMSFDDAGPCNLRVLMSDKAL